MGAAKAGSQRTRLVTGLLAACDAARTVGGRLTARRPRRFKGRGAAGPRRGARGRDVAAARGRSLLRVDRDGLRACVAVLDAAAPPGDVAALEVALVALAGGDEAVARGACAWLATAPGPLAATARGAAGRGYLDAAAGRHREACGVAAAALAAPPSDGAARRRSRARAGGAAPGGRRRRRRAAGRGAGARPSSGVPALAETPTGRCPQAGTVAVAVAAVAAGDGAGDVGVLIRSGLVVHAARGERRGGGGARRGRARARRGRGPGAQAAVDAAAAARPRRCSPAAATTPSTRR